MAANPLNEQRDAIRALMFASETQVVNRLLESLSLPETLRISIGQKAAHIICCARARKEERGALEVFMQTFGLSTNEGIALLSLAEALLRVPDKDTADNLIAEKIHAGNWSRYCGQSDSTFVNLVMRGLALSSNFIELDEQLTGEKSHLVRSLISRLGEFTVRNAIRRAIQIMSDEFVLGHTIEKALERAENSGIAASFDMLGEGARTAKDAQRHFNTYLQAIDKTASAGLVGPVLSHGISVKLSALHPRYQYSNRDRVTAELLPRIRHLALQASKNNIQLTIDAEEAARLDLSLDLIEALARDRQLADWHGLGVALQCYSKRASAVLDWLIALARDTRRRIIIRLVKGAYWDTEIKRAQELGLPEYPVFTRKINTDVSYLACAQKMLKHPDTIYPQFATHNAHTIVAIMEMADKQSNFEFQRLHGMGRLLYSAAHEVLTDMPLVRVYAPVGEHRDLLGYLVRRLLENGANTSFVNRFMEESLPPEQLVEDPLARIQSLSSLANPRIPLPIDLYGSRRNSAGLDLSDPSDVSELTNALGLLRCCVCRVGPIVNGRTTYPAARPVTNPADRADIVGFVSDATHEDIDKAIAAALNAQIPWNHIGGEDRAVILERAAHALENERYRFLSLLVREAGKTLDDAIAELREAVDFCRYYAEQAREHFRNPTFLVGPSGEDNAYRLYGRGVFVCISPWNFPLAIFIGQVAAALAAGNSVIAKPAEQTPLIAAATVELLHRVGIPAKVLHLLPGPGKTVGASLVANERIAGIAMTGSHATAKHIGQTLSQRRGPIIPFIAETGGQNAMFVDSTALPEQVVDDVIRSAFHSAGQRCSALRVLYLQEDIAESVLTMLKGAMDELAIGNPADPATDIGPVIDDSAKVRLLTHIAALEADGRLLHKAPFGERLQCGTFVPPHLFEITSIKALDGEHFGPILHVIRYRSQDLDAHLAELRETGFGLTLGIHSRIEAMAHKIFKASCAGNVYVNRNMIGAVVGVQPFGGFGLSGTGPKAGGPLYLQRFAIERVLTTNTGATGGNISLLCDASDY